MKLDRVQHLSPQWFAVNGALYRMLWHANDARRLELCRLASARLLKCGPESAILYTRDGRPLVTPHEIEALPEFFRSDLFSPLDRAVLAFAEQSILDVHGVTDEMADALRPDIEDEKFYCFSLALGMIECWQRLLIVLQTPDELGGQAARMLGIETVPAKEIRA